MLNILKAFDQANAQAEKARRDAVEYHFESGLIPAQYKKAMETPLIQHGISANRKVLETVAQWSFEQGLTPRLVQLEEMFAAQTHEL